MITSIGNAAIWVTDLERSEAFYVRGLGLDVIARIDTPDVRELIVGRGDAGTQVMLAALTAAGDEQGVMTPTSVLPDSGSAPGGFWKMFLWTDALEDDVARAISAGGSLVEAPRTMAEFGLSIAVVTDPDGHLVEFGCVA